MAGVRDGSRARCFPGGMAQAATVPYAQSFESYTNGSLIAVEGAANCSVSDLDTGAARVRRGQVTTATAAPASAKSLRVTNAQAQATFSDNETFAFAEFYARPVLGPATGIPLDASVVFYVNATGSVVAYNGTTPVLRRRRHRLEHMGEVPRRRKLYHLEV